MLRQFTKMFLLTVIMTSAACATDQRNSNPAIQEPPLATETITFKSPVHKLIISNTSGTTIIDNNTPTKESAPARPLLEIVKVKTSDICEFNKKQEGDTLYVHVRNRGFTGTGDCEINLRLSMDKLKEITVSTTTGAVSLNMPKDSKLNFDFNSKSGKLNSDFLSDAKAGLRVHVQTQSGDLNIKSL